MGCDIHGPYVERRAPGETWWSHVATFDLPRHYATFAAMAGVRADSDDEILFLPRGVPSDAALPDDGGDGRDDGHSASWLTAYEVELVAYHVDDAPVELLALAAAMNTLERHVTPDGTRDRADVRAIFWFDS